MPLSPEQIDLFKKLAPFIEIEVGMKLSSLLNGDVKIEYVGVEDSIIDKDKITIKEDSFFVTVRSEDYGPISLVVSNPQVLCVSKLVTGGDGTADDETKLDENNQNLYSETISQVIKSLFARLEQFMEGATFKLGSHEAKALESTKEETLAAPEGVEDSVALGFKIKLATKMDDTIHLELNSAALEYILNQFTAASKTLSLENFKARLKEEYKRNSDSQKELQARLGTLGDSVDDAYKVDEKRNLTVLSDINLDLVVELGRSEMQFSQLLRLTRGSAIELDKQCDDPVDLYAHNQLIARGEVVAIDDCFGLKITEILGDLQLARKLGLSLK